MRTPLRVSLILLLAISIAAAAVFVNQAPAVAAGALLHPARRPLVVARPAGCRDARFDGLDVELKGWICPSRVERRGTIVFLHGVADNRAGTAGAFDRFVARGFDIIAYDSRAHGESGGDACTYGYYEKEDLRRVIAATPSGPVVLIGGSLGAAVALQAAAVEQRVTAVVAAEVFSDLEAVARERAPSFLTDGVIRRAFRVAEQQGRFEIARVSPADAARRITVPVLLIHGALHTDTSPAHSQRVYDQLRGPKRLIVVPGARHNQSLASPVVWDEMQRWIESTTVSR